MYEEQEKIAKNNGKLEKQGKKYEKKGKSLVIMKKETRHAI